MYAIALPNNNKKIGAAYKFKERNSKFLVIRIKQGESERISVRDSQWMKGLTK